jgi:hypothetical protein
MALKANRNQFAQFAQFGQVQQNSFAAQRELA